MAEPVGIRQCSSLRFDEHAEERAALTEPASSLPVVRDVKRGHSTKEIWLRGKGKKKTSFRFHPTWTEQESETSYAVRSVPDNSEDWNRLREELIGVRQRMIEILSEATMRRNEPEIFVKRFWRDFYHALLSNAARRAMKKLLLLVIGISLG